MRLENYLHEINDACGVIQSNIDKNTQITWNHIKGMRNITVHGYFELDIELVWKTLISEILLLKANTEEVLEIGNINNAK